MCYLADTSKTEYCDIFLQCTVSPSKPWSKYVKVIACKLEASSFRFFLSNSIIIHATIIPSQQDNKGKQKHQINRDDIIIAHVVTMQITKKNMIRP